MISNVELNVLHNFESVISLRQDYQLNLSKIANNYRLERNYTLIHYSSCYFFSSKKLQDTFEQI